MNTPQENTPNQPTGENIQIKDTSPLRKKILDILQECQYDFDYGYSKENGALNIRMVDRNKASYELEKILSSPTPSSPIDVEQEAKEYANKQGTNYPVHISYQQMINSQIESAFKAGWEARQPVTPVDEDGWFDVKLKEPPTGSDDPACFLIYGCKRGNIDEDIAGHEMIASYNVKKKIWEDSYGKDIENNPDYWFVTHWRYLPQPPNSNPNTQ